MASFRPLPVLTLLMLPALGLLIWLGSWQLDRRAWKIELLADYAATAQAEPLTLSDGLCEGQAELGRRVLLDGAQPLSGLVRVSGRNAQGAPGWRLFSPLMVCGTDQLVLVETGFEGLQTATRADDSSVVEADAFTQLRFETPLAQGPFTPPANPEANEFYAFDADGLGARLDIDPERLNTRYWLALSDGAPPAYLTQTPPERHLAYAITWFGMMLALLAVYFAYHIQVGRLQWRG
ncbi:SURF1 family protein [Oceanicaulis sp. LC35]|uniref:SURF1 family protein n=1 Tax=Oceanicaulis sp. LC35 TaxID=3349635 RepID=UPI003F8657C3